MKRLLLGLLASALLLTGCGAAGNDKAAAPGSSPSSAQGGGQIVKTTEEDAANAVMLSLKKQDLETLSSYIHPEKGVLFSPYLHIQPDAVVFTRDEMPSFEDSTLYTWGKHDGSGEPITLSFKDYYSQFVYNKPFYEAEQIAYNEILQTGNMALNISDRFPGSFTADYHFSGFDPQYEGLDWQSLIIVIESFNGFWYVSAIIHSQWTV